MARAGKKTYYWDTCCFIAWLDGGKGHAPGVLAGLDEIANEIDKNRANLITSVFTDTEVLEGKLTPEQAHKFQSLFKRRNVISIAVDGKIAAKASEIRNYYTKEGKRVSFQDSVHLATAIIYEADEFHTLDGIGGGGILRFNGSVAGHSLHIRVPVAKQSSLFATVPAIHLLPSERGDANDKANQASANSSSIGFQAGSGGHIENKTGEIKTESAKDGKEEIKS